MNQSIKLYKNKENDYVLELWGASTKHPDSIFHMVADEKFKINEYLDLQCQVFQWLLLCASELSWPFHAKALTEYALKHWYNW